MARAVLKADGRLEESQESLPPGGRMRLPANWQLGGLDNFHGRVRFERTFEFDALRDDETSAWLVFKGVDYYATIWLNGQLLGSHEGYFQPFELDATDALQHGTNTLTVEVTCPLEEPGAVWPDRKLMIKGILSHWDARPGSWDPRTGQDRNSGGIWNDVLLELRPIAYLGHVRVSTRLVPRDAPEGFAVGTDLPEDVPLQAMVLVEAEVVGPAGEHALRVKLGDEPEVRLPMSRSADRHAVVVQVPEPKLWWTWDLGEPCLYSCTVRLEREDRTLCEQKLAVGLREVEFDPERGQWTLNRRRFFLRGTNVVPTLWLGEYDEQRIERDIQMLRDAHINGVRVCVHVNREEFYDACDRVGILVWQDFALQWGYSERQEFLQEAVRQIKDMVRLLVNHPCIGLWCCQNESTFHNKYILDPVLTEFGAQALPDEASMHGMVGESWPPDWERLAYHDFQYDQTFHVAHVEMGGNWPEFIASSQEYQSRLLKFAIERYRQAKYKALGGMFQFMFMDCWPSVTWSVVTSDRTPKRGYYTLQECYQPVLIGVNLARDSVVTGGSGMGAFVLRPWVVNDRHDALRDCTYSLAVSGVGGRFKFYSKQAFDVPADGVLEQAPAIHCDLPADLEPGRYTLELSLHAQEGVVSHNTYELSVVTVPSSARRTMAGVEPEWEDRPDGWADSTRE